MLWKLLKIENVELVLIMLLISTFGETPSIK